MHNVNRIHFLTFIRISFVDIYNTFFLQIKSFVPCTTHCYFTRVKCLLSRIVCIFIFIFNHQGTLVLISHTTATTVSIIYSKDIYIVFPSFIIQCNLIQSIDQNILNNCHNNQNILISFIIE